MDWFRFYSEVVRDPKVQKLSPTMFKHWINVLCLANDNDPRGRVPMPSDVAFHLRIAEGRAVNMLDELVALKLLDVDDDGNLTPHGWSARQYKSDTSTERVQKHRRNVSVTPPEAETEQSRTETDEEETPARRNVFVLYDQYMGRPSITAMMRPVLVQAEEDYPEECITHCFEEAAKSSDGRRSWSYVAAILKRHQAEGCNERKQMGRDTGGVPQARGAPAVTRESIYPGITWPVFVPDPGAANLGPQDVANVDDSARLEVWR